MGEQTLFETLKYDLHIIGVPVDFKLVLKHYSKRYNGRYDPNTNKLIIYLYEDEECTKMRSYEDILETAIHEGTHHHQWCHDKSFVRVKGIMHDPKFLQLERFWRLRAKSYGLLMKEVV